MPSVTKLRSSPAREQNHRPTTTPKAGGVLDRIKGIEFDDQEGIKLLLYGKSGTGKTTTWGSFPGPILAIVCSGGNRSGELRSLDTPEHRKKISQVQVERSTDVREIVDHQASTGKYKTVVLDHASGLQDRVLAEILNIEEIPAQKTWGLATQQQYGQLALQCKEHFRALLNLTCNVVIVAQERDFNTESVSSGDVMIVPTVGAALTPSLAGWLYPACDYIVNTFKRQRMVERTVKVAGKEVVQKQAKGVEFCGRVGPDAVFTTKFRIPKGRTLPDSIVNPDYEQIMELINGGK